MLGDDSAVLVECTLVPSAQQPPERAAGEHAKHIHQDDQHRHWHRVAHGQELHSDRREVLELEEQHDRRDQNDQSDVDEAHDFSVGFLGSASV